MTVAALYDIHGMLDALDAVLAKVEREDVDVVLLGGDVVGGPQPAEVLARVRQIDREVVWIRGNGERALVDGSEWVAGGGSEVLAWTAARLSPADRAFFGSRPLRAEVEIDGLGRVLFFHATPDWELPLVTAETPDAHLGKLLRDVAADVAVSGHTHTQFDRTVNGIRWVNAGSVGMPYEGEVAAFWTVLGPEISFRKTPFDVAAAIEAVLVSGWPEAEGFVAENLRAAVTREEAIAFFEQKAVELGQRD